MNNKQEIKINEKQLKQIVSESVKKVLNENVKMGIDGENGYTMNEISEIIKQMGQAVEDLLYCQNRLYLACGFNEGFEFNGKYITKEQLESWTKTLEDIYNVCYY